MARELVYVSCDFTHIWVMSGFNSSNRLIVTPCFDEMRAMLEIAKPRLVHPRRVRDSV